MRALPKRRIFDLVGESSVNADGSGRQTALRQVAPGEPVEFVREPGNPHGANAVLIVAERLKVGIGYLSKDDAGLWAPVIDSGTKISGRVHELTGGLEEYPSFGCRVCIVAAGKPFNRYRELQPEQIYYEHAPTWRPNATVTSSKPTVRGRKKAGGGLVAGLLAGLFK